MARATFTSLSPSRSWYSAWTESKHSLNTYRMELETVSFIADTLPFILRRQKELMITSVFSLLLLLGFYYSAWYGAVEHLILEGMPVGYGGSGEANFLISTACFLLKLTPLQTLTSSFLNLTWPSYHCPFLSCLHPRWASDSTFYFRS